MRKLVTMESSRDGGERMSAWEGTMSQVRKLLRWDLKTTLFSSEVDLAIWSAWVMSQENSRLGREQGSCLEPPNIRVEVFGEAQRGEKEVRTLNL